MSNSDIRVVVFRPTDDHPTLADEVEDGKVDEAVAAAKLAYAELDADGDIEDFTYAGDLDDVAREIAREAQGTRVLAVVVTDFVSDDQQSAVDAFSGLDDDFVVLVKVSNQPVDEAFATRLDDGPGTANKVDVVTVDGLRDRATAYAEVADWAGVTV
jgi:hypothetical protein